MTIWDALRSLVRRWYIPLIALAVALALSQAVMGASGAYWSRAEVTFLAPTSTDNPNALRPTSSDLVVTAAVVSKLVNGSTVRNRMADPAATIVGEGVFDGWAVQLPNYGGQWSRVYPRQVLDVQVSGPTRDVVRERHYELLSRIDQALSTLQAGVLPEDRITTVAIPQEPRIRYVSGSSGRAVVMVWLLCGAGALTATTLVESSIRKRRNPATRRAAAVRPADTA